MTDSAEQQVSSDPGTSQIAPSSIVFVEIGPRLHQIAEKALGMCVTENGMTNVLHALTRLAECAKSGELGKVEIGDNLRIYLNQALDEPDGPDQIEAAAKLISAASGTKLDINV